MSATGASAALPFVGLRPFDTTDAAWFFGRDRETAALTRKLRASRFTAVVGPSGSGKSSVVRAGVVPLLQPDRWQQIILMPGSAPLNRLANALASAEPEDQLADARRSRFYSMLRASAFGLVEIAGNLQVHAPRLLLVIDQFEELFRYGEQATGVQQAAMREEARAFVELLLNATSDRAGRLHVCITMRSDYFGQCSAYAGLAEAISASQYLIPLPQRDQLEEAIRKPVAKAGANIEEGLVQRLLVDVVEETDQLPLLQHTLRRLWDQAAGDPRTMREADYVTVGKIAGSIDKKAEAVIAALSKGNPSDINTSECVMKALTDLDERGRATRRAQKRSALLALVSERMADAAAKGADASLERVLTALRAEDASFLQIGEGADPEVDITHEALIRSWGRLCGAQHDFTSGWLREERDDGERWRDYVRRAVEGITLDPRELDTLSAKLNPHTFGEVWSKRYGDHWSDVLELKQKSSKKKYLTRALNAIILFSLATSIVATLFTGYAAYHRGIEASQQAAVVQNSFKRSVTSAQMLLDQLSTSVDRGDITIKGATGMLKTAGDIVAQVSNAEKTAETALLLAKLGITASNIYQSLGDYSQAEESAKESKELAEWLRANSPDDTEVLQLLYTSVSRMGDVISFRGGSQANQEQALTEYLQAEKVAHRLVDKQPENEMRLRDLVLIYQKIGDTYLTLDKRTEALVSYRNALPLIEDVTGPNREKDWQQDLANTHRRIGIALLNMMEYDGALDEYRKAIDIRTRMANEDPNNDTVQSNLQGDYRSMANLFVKQNRLDDALDAYQNAIAIQERLRERDPSNSLWMFSLAFLNNAIGNVLTMRGDSAGASESYRKAYEFRQLLARNDPTSEDRQKRLAMAAITLADSFQGQKRNLDEAVRLYREGISILDRLGKTQYSDDTKVFASYIAIGDIRLLQGNPDEALSEDRRAWAIAQGGADDSKTAADRKKWQSNLENSYNKIANLLSSPAEKLDHYRQSLEIVTELAANHPESEEWRALTESLKAKTP